MIPINIEIAYDIRNIFFWNKRMFFNILKLAFLKLSLWNYFYVNQLFVFYSKILKSNPKFTYLKLSERLIFSNLGGNYFKQGIQKN